MTGEMTKCLHCGKPVITITYTGYGTAWTHLDGYRECPPTYAAPDLMNLRD